MSKREKNRGGYTLVELLAAISIMLIVAAVSVFGITAWVNQGRFTNAESGAKSLFLCAESALSYLESSGELDAFMEEVKRTGEPVSVTYTDTFGNSQTRVVYGLRGDNERLRKLIAPYLFDQTVFNYAICIEFDPESRQVYSAFYSTEAAALVYAAGDGTRNGTVSMNERTFEVRKGLGLGYYSSIDLANVRIPETKKLKITSIQLRNEETLHLTWTSNAQEKTAVGYDVALFADDPTKPILTILHFGWEEGWADGWKDAKLENGDTVKVLVNADESGGFTVTLDAMVTAALQEASGTADKLMSFSRVDGIQADSRIYATVRATPNESYTDIYTASGIAKSNPSNPFFGEGSSKSAVHINQFRHLSNIRYFASLGGADLATFTLDASNLTWGSAPIYAETAMPALHAALAFPTVPELKSGWTLNGNSWKGHAISGLRLGRVSGLNDAGAEAVQLSVKDSQDALGLFGESRGVIQNLKLIDPGMADDRTGRTYAAAGLLAGRGYGDIQNVIVSMSQPATRNEDAADISIKIAAPAAAGAPCGLGGLVGVQTGGTIEECTVAGALTGEITGEDPARADGHYPMGIGGVAGHAADTAFKNVINHADVTGNAMTGGIAGACISSEANTGGFKACENDGTILCSAAAQESGYIGRCIGGIAGYGKDIPFEDCSAGPGAGGAQTLTGEQIKARMLGRYVGGIVGLCDGGNIRGCHTEANTYVIGGDYVGGITGVAQPGLLDGRMDNGASVLGNSYVGGIAGQNETGSSIEGCENTGAVLAYKEYAGGIAGHNSGTLTNCESQIYDYGNAKFKQLNDWVQAWDDFEGDHTGGIAGYNNGAITYTGSKPLATIVVGGDFTGGLVGFNDSSAAIDLGGRTLGSRVQGEDFTGGFIGLNRCAAITNSTAIKPYGVDGKDFVGGVIGASILNAPATLELKALANATVEGKQYVGGVMGYFQMLSDSGTFENFLTLTQALQESTTPGNREGFKMAGQGDFSAGEAACTIGTEGTPQTVNSLTVHASAFGGGVLGYCEPGSRINIQNCINTGSVTRNPAATDADLLPLSAYTANEFSDLRGSFLGGIIGLNPEKGTITACSNSGAISADVATGGIVGVNQGAVQDCAVDVNIGGSKNSFVGGIAAINDRGTIEGCTLQNGYTITADDYVGGIAALNLGTVRDSHMDIAALNAAGDHIGGIVGYNMAVGTQIGKVEVNRALSNLVSLAGGENVGGVIGRNKGELNITGMTGGVLPLANARIQGNTRVGGVVGLQQGGKITGASIRNVAQVTALNGMAGGIVGEAEGRFQLENATNAGTVIANQGMAGGIVAKLGVDGVLVGCVNTANVSTGYQGALPDNQRAGGIVAINSGHLINCRVRADGNSVDIAGRDYTGGLAGENYGTIESCVLITTGTQTITVRDSATHGARGIGGAVGYNDANAVVKNIAVGSGVRPYQQSGGALIVALGGVVGENHGTVMQDTTSQDAIAPALAFHNVRYAGGIVGDNQGAVSGFAFSGSLYDSGASGGGYCMGGIVGRNGNPDGAVSATVANCAVTLDTASGRAALHTTGVFNATITDNHAIAARNATLLGGVAGANYAGASLSKVTLTTPNLATAQMLNAQKGMVGGITGYNNGSITEAGDPDYATLFALANHSDMDLLDTAALALYRTPTYAADNVNQITVSNGHAGGIAGSNGEDGVIANCLSGKWYVKNTVATADPCAGGIIGINTGTKELSHLISFAKVRRTAHYVAGGIIGRQESGTSGWRMNYCANYGPVAAGNSGLAGGIIGNLKYACGTLEQCWNRGELRHLNNGNVTNTAGIIARVYRSTPGETLNLIACKNYAAAQGGILHDMQPEGARKLTINLVECVNFGKVTGAGMMSAPYSGSNISLKLLRCRNYGGGNGLTLGLFNLTADGSVVATDCFDISARDGDQTPGDYNNVNKFFGARNYYLKDSNVQNPLQGLQSDTTLSSSVVFTPNATPATRPAQLYIINTQNHGYVAVELTQGVEIANLTSADSKLTTRANETDSLYIVSGDTNNVQAKVILELGTATPPALETGAADYDQMAQAYYQRAYSATGLNAPTKVGDNPLVQTLGKQNVITWADTNPPVYYYDVEVYCFNTLAEATAAEANAGAITGDFGRITNLRAYEKTLTFDAPDSWEGKFYMARVRAHGSKDNQTSPWLSEAGTLAAFLTPPQVRGELVQKEGGGVDYRFYLDPEFPALAAGYQKKAEEAGYAYRVRITVGDRAPIYLTKDRLSVYENGGYTETKPLSAQVELVPIGQVLDPNATILSRSVQTDKQTDLLHMNNANVQINSVTAALHGTTADNLTCLVTLNKTQAPTPTYRVELVKEKAGSKIVVAYADVALAGNSQSVTLTGLPADLLTDLDPATGDSIFVRAWLSRTTNGPAYAYHELAVDADGTPITQETVYQGNTAITRDYPVTSKIHTADMAAGEYRYLHSVAVQTVSASCYKRMSLTLPALLAAPIPEDAALFTASPDGSADSYTFTWDKGTVEAGAQYSVSVAGVNRDGSGETVINLYTETMTAEATNFGTDSKMTLVRSGDAIAGWSSYDQIRLTVTRIGKEDANGVAIEIGRSASKDYTLDRRLSQVENVSVAFPQDRHTMVHTVSWNKLADESKCGAYRVEVAAEGIEPLMKELIAPFAGDARSIALDLEAFAGKNINVNVTAIAQAGATNVNPKMYDSIKSDTARYTVQSRLENKLTALQKGWVDAPMSEADFLGGAISFTQDASQVLSGTYEMQGWVYTLEGAAAANGAQGELNNANKDPWLKAAGARQTSVITLAPSGTVYSGVLRAATGLARTDGGQNIAIMTRATEEGRISSKWELAGNAELPKIQLATPVLTEGATWRTVEKNTYVNATDSTLSGPSAEESVSMRSIAFAAIPDAVRYTVRLTGSTKHAVNVASPTSLQETQMNENFEVTVAELETNGEKVLNTPQQVRFNKDLQYFSYTTDMRLQYQDGLFTLLLCDPTDTTISYYNHFNVTGVTVTAHPDAASTTFVDSVAGVWPVVAAPAPQPAAPPAPAPQPVAPHALQAALPIAPNATPTPAPGATATPAPGATATPAPAPAPTATATPTPAPAPTATATPTPAPTATATPTPAPTATATPTPAPAATATPTPAPAPTATATPTPAPTATPTPTPAPMAAPTPTETPAPKDEAQNGDDS